jgi:hypothetical protein
MTVPISMPDYGPDMSELGFGNLKDLDGYSIPTLPTPKSGIDARDWLADDRLDMSRHPMGSNTNRPDNIVTEGRRGPQNLGKSNDQGFARTMAGLADILRQGGRDS